MRNTYLIKIAPVNQRIFQTDTSLWPQKTEREPLVKTLKDKSQDTKKYVTRKMRIKLVELKNTLKENNFRNKSDVRVARSGKRHCRNSSDIRGRA